MFGEVAATLLASFDPVEPQRLEGASFNILLLILEPAINAAYDINHINSSGELIKLFIVQTDIHGMENTYGLFWFPQ